MNNRLKQLNASQTPRGSMGMSLMSRTRPAHDATHDERPAKRAKQTTDPHSGGLTSKYFSPQPPKKTREDVDEDTADEPRPQIHDLTRDGSQAETIESSSVTSTGKNTSATSGMPEFRIVQARGAVKGNSRQRRKAPVNRTGSSFRDNDDAQAIKHRNLAPQTSPHTGTSPDCLGGGDDDLEPPPVRIVSDVVPPPKRSAPDQYQRPSSKRYRHIAGSEDELSMPAWNRDRDVTKKPTNFSKLISQPSRRPQQRGDIPPTVFKATRSIPQNPGVASDEPALPDVTVAGAACGRFKYLSSDPQEKQVKFHLEEGFARVFQDGKPATNRFPWLELKFGSIQSVKHAASKTPYFVIKRSARDGTGLLALQLESASQATLMHKWLFDVGQQERGTHDDLEQIFKRTFDRAVSYDKQNPRRSLEVKHSASSEQKHNKPKDLAELRDPFKGEPTNPRPTKLKDRMQGAPEPAKEVQCQSVEEVAPVTRSQGPETRRTRKSSPAPLFRERSLDRWTLQNPNWDKDWHRSLVYPPTGKNRATVDKDDIPRLDEGEFLNDNLISFYLRYLQIKVEAERPAIMDKVYIFNTFFFEKLRSNRVKINYDGVKAWTARVDLLSYDYIVVPVNENNHWYLAIIYNAPKLLPQTQTKESPSERETIVLEDSVAARSPKLSPVERNMAAICLDEEVSKPTRSSHTVNGFSELPAKTNKRKSTGGSQRFSLDEPRIITLDSLGSAHSPTCKCLRDYLVEEARDKKGFEIVDPPGGMTARNIPQQDNFCDCGVFILGYMEHFLKDPDEAVRKLLHREETQWDIRPPEIRAKVRDLLFKLQREQHERLEEEKEMKRKRKAAKEAARSSQVAASSPRGPPETPQTPQVDPKLQSPVPNGVEDAATKVPEQAPQTSAYFRLVSPETPAQPRTPKRDEGTNSAPPLNHGPNGDVKTSSSVEVFHSARSSPPKEASRESVDLTVDENSPLAEKQAAKKQPPSGFIQRLSSPPKTLVLANTSPTLRRHSSPEIVICAPRPSSSARAAHKPRSVDPEPHIIDSIEVDEPSVGGAQYDGIDRTVDLTL
ncbi:hypothetical protein ACJ41O_013446 [Fusarium nematophilum]